MISREKSILAPICWNAKILESIDQIWFHATFFSVLVFLFGIYGEFTHITINLFQSLKCLRTWKHMKDFSVMKASQFIEIDWWCWWIKSAYNRYTKRIGERERESLRLSGFWAEATWLRRTPTGHWTVRAGELGGRGYPHTKRRAAPLFKQFSLL